MKNLSFRGKRLDNGEWVSSGSIIRQLAEVDQTTEHRVYIADAGDEFIAILDAETDNMLAVEKGTFYRIDPETVGQWTGLLDRNGKRIFEGDIVKIPDDYEEYGFAAGEIYAVYFAYGGFRLKPKYNVGSKGFWLEDDETVEILGNIYDNPELIQGADHEL